ncbi:MAG TPA: hypothetical protein VLD37_05545 [Candidatus Bilamarchaeum sp.]|nr:hypothetical protein [Candidatus Bilamarchaeum sp.]
MKGQTSLELLVTLGVVIAFTVPVIFLLLSVTSVGYEDTSKAQADAASRTLADTMNAVYAQGDGAQRELLLNVPPSTQEVKVVRVGSGTDTASEAIVTIKTSGGDFQAASPSIAKIRGFSQEVEKKAGLFTLCVKNENGEVQLVESSCSTP